jgi:hypothetical protein
MSQREQNQNFSPNQILTDLMKKIIYVDPQKTIGRRRATMECEVLKNISILRIEYLSLNNSFIKNLKFVKYFSNLWYLDVRNNPVKN